jgi:hypothetical protein
MGTVLRILLLHQGGLALDLASSVARPHLEASVDLLSLWYNVAIKDVLANPFSVPPILLQLTFGSLFTVGILKFARVPAYLLDAICAPA